jgi:hypothetical protein
MWIDFRLTFDGNLMEISFDFRSDDGLPVTVITIFSWGSILLDALDEYVTAVEIDGEVFITDVSTKMLVFVLDTNVRIKNSLNVIHDYFLLLLNNVSQKFVLRMCLCLWYWMHSVLCVCFYEGSQDKISNTMPLITHKRPLHSRGELIYEDISHFTLRTSGVHTHTPQLSTSHLSSALHSTEYRKEPSALGELHLMKRDYRTGCLKCPF